MLLLYNSSIFSQIDGMFDTTFATNGQLITTFLPAFAVVANAIKIQSDSKIVIAGRQNPSIFFVARYNKDGTQDTTFGTNGFTFTTIPGVSSSGGSDMAIQPDGKIIVSGGGILSGSNHNAIVLARYTTSGQLDTTFNSTGIVIIDTGVVGDFRQRAMIAINHAGKIVIATTVGPFGGAPQGLLAQFLPDGSLDTSFGINGMTTPNLFGGTYTFFFQVQIQNDQRIIVIGDFSPDGVADQFFVARYTQTGELDTSFNRVGYVITSLNVGAAGGGIAGDGKIVAYGSNATPPLYMVRYNMNGSLDSTFGTGGIGMYEDIGNIVTPSSLAFQTDGKIVVEAGTSVAMQNALGVIRVNSDGTLDRAFGQNGIAIASVLGTAGNNTQPRALTIDANSAITALAVVMNNAIGIVRLEVESLHHSTLSLALWQRYYNQNIVPKINN